MSIKKVLIPVVDGDKENALHPDTFLIPSEADKHRIKPGNYVKAGFAGILAPAVERMWVRVVIIDGGVIRGRLANEPVVLMNAKLGDPVKMGLRHVLAIEDR